MGGIRDAKHPRGEWLPCMSRAKSNSARNVSFTKSSPTEDPAAVMNILKNLKRTPRPVAYPPSL